MLVIKTYGCKNVLMRYRLYKPSIVWDKKSDIKHLLRSFFSSSVTLISFLFRLDKESVNDFNFGNT